MSFSFCNFVSEICFVLVRSYSISPLRLHRIMKKKKLWVSKNKLLFWKKVLNFGCKNLYEQCVTEVTLFFFFFLLQRIIIFSQTNSLIKREVNKMLLHSFLSEVKIKHYLLPRRKLLIMLSLDLLFVVCFRVILELHTNYHGGLLKYHSWNSTLCQVCEPLFCYTAVVYVITHCPCHKGVLHDDTNNGCAGEQWTFKTVYILSSWILVIHKQWA